MSRIFFEIAAQDSQPTSPAASRAVVFPDLEEKLIRLT